MIKIKKIKFRKILNSAGRVTFEIEMIDEKGIKAVASSPSAIKAGKREVATTKEFNASSIDSLVSEIYGKEIKTQKEFDSIVNQYIKEVGSDICLSLSLAFARIMSQREEMTLVEYIAQIANYKTKNIVPKALVTIFSGGVHNERNTGSIQNIMISVNITPFSEAIIPIVEIYTDIEKQLKEKNILEGYGTSSGMLVSGMTTDKKFQMVLHTIKRLGYEKKVTIAIDVAAEHFFKNNIYEYQGESLNSNEMKQIIMNYKERYNLTYIEDPFAPNDEKKWCEFKTENSEIAIVGDDLFATQNQYINTNLANGIIIKMNQVGTLTGSIETFKRAKEENMITCISHRSIETEDTFMCDLAVALEADYIKIGGPRRGDRISKYNQLLRLEEEIKS